MGKILVYGFSAIFVAIGIGIGYAGYSDFANEGTSNPLLMGAAALAFAGAGLAVFFLTRAGFRAQASAEALQAARPDEPWTWREDWAAGRVRSSRTSTAAFLWGFGILWNLITIPLMVFLPEEIMEKGNMAALLGLLFPIAGIGIIIAAARMTMQQRRFGNCEFILDRNPGVLGGDVSGSILIPRGVPGAHTFTVRLSCLHLHRQRSGKSTSTTETVLWQSEQSINRASAPSLDGPQRFGVRFRTPFDAKQTETIDSDNAIVWRLVAEAAVPGVDFATEFDLPVFKTADSSPDATEEQLRAEVVAAHPPVITPDTTGISTLPTSGGGTEFIVRPTGKGNGTVGALIAFLIFAGVTGLIIHFGGSSLFVLIFGAITLLIAALGLFGRYGESHIVIEDGHVSVRNMLFGIMSGNRVPCSSVQKIGLRGEGSQSARGIYSITLTLADGKSLSPWQTTANKPAAEWLAEEVRQAMSPWRQH